MLRCSGHSTASPPASRARNSRRSEEDAMTDTRIKGLHHNAYRCRDSQETRKFYEGFLGLPLVNAFEITETKSGRSTHVLHSFYAMDNGGCVAFFEDPSTP